MKLDSDAVRAIALEGRLSLTDAELAGAVRYINNFLEMVDRFKELDLTNVEPFAFAESVECPLREDVVGVFPNGKEILAARSTGTGPAFTVPRIMGE
ncbi:MAG: hypothetical protein LBR61_01845 [Synergistaceae bacterium]|jgi:aspartyl/glutamyl-tRNA(Asn/Gln) amidotransferase C subunit|nr:hypothetical protein [Synergistaceae bacterium]